MTRRARRPESAQRPQNAQRPQGVRRTPAGWRRGPLARPDVARLWGAGLVSDTGDWLLFVALPVVVFQLTGSALGTSVAFVVELLPAVLLAPLAARLADRCDRRHVLVAATLAQAVALLPLLIVHGRTDLPVLYGVIAAEAALAAIFEPTKNAVLPSLFAPDELVGGNALIGLNQNLGRLVGGPLGGVLLAVGNLRLVVVVDLITFLASAALLARLSPGIGRPVDPATATSAPSARAAPRAGSLRAALREPGVVPAVAVMAVTQIAQGIFLVLFVVFVAERLGGGAGETGLLRGVQAVGALGAGLLLATLGRRCGAARLVAASALAFGLLDLVVWNASSFTRSPWCYVVLFVIIGAPGVVLGTGLVSVVQSAAPARHRGAAFSALGCAANLGQGVGLVAAGVLAGPLGLMTLLNAQAVVYLVAGVLAAGALGRSVDARRSGRVRAGWVRAAQP